MLQDKFLSPSDTLLLLGEEWRIVVFGLLSIAGSMTWALSCCWICELDNSRLSEREAAHQFHVLPPWDTTWHGHDLTLIWSGTFCSFQVPAHSHSIWVTVCETNCASKASNEGGIELTKATSIGLTFDVRKDQQKR